MSNELCDDEGCPHHGTPHVCLNNVQVVTREDTNNPILKSLEDWAKFFEVEQPVLEPGELVLVGIDYEHNSLQTAYEPAQVSFSYDSFETNSSPDNNGEQNDAQVSGKSNDETT